MLANSSGWPWRQKKKEEQDWRIMHYQTAPLAMEMDKERKARLEKMVATTELMLALIKGVANVGVVLSLKPILKSWQLCLSFKLDVHRHPQLKKYRS